MQRVSLRELREILPRDVDETYIKVEFRDPDFWEKVTDVSVNSYWKGGEFCTDFEYYMRADNILGELKGGKGYVYILTSSQQEGICKIGSTERTPLERLKEINSATGVILPWTLYAAFSCNAPRVVEKLVHKILADLRISRNKEGFAIYPEKAEEIITGIIKACN